MSESENNIALYAAIKTFQANGSDMLSAVSLFCLLIIADGSSLSQIQENFSNEYKISVPEDVLKTVLSRLAREGYISYKSFQEVHIADKGKTRIIELNSSVEGTRREFNSLVADLKRYYASKKYKETKSGLEIELLSFIDDNIGFTSRVITGKSKKGPNGSKIAEYILHIEKTKPELYKILQNIFFGRIYLLLVKTRAQFDVKARFDNLTVYLDTNIIFSILGLHGEEARKPASELLKVLKYAGNIRIAVFDITVREALAVIHAYRSESQNYSESIPVDSIYYRLKLSKTGPQELALLEEKFEEKLNELGVEVESTRTIEEKDLAGLIHDLSSAAAKVNQHKTDSAIIHDSKVYQLILDRRGNVRTKLLEKCRAVFITADRSVYNYSLQSAERDFTFPFFIRPVDVVSMLWIKSLGKDEVGTNVLRQVLMGYARERAISENLWNQFVRQLTEAESKGEITEKDIGLIMSSDETERLLVKDQFEAPRKIATQKYAKHLRQERIDLLESREKVTGVLETVLIRIDLIAHIIALALCIIIWFLVIAAISTGVFFAIKLFGMSTIAAVIPFISIFFVLVVVLLFGGEFKWGAFVLGARQWMYSRIKSRIEMRIKKVLKAPH